MRFLLAIGLCIVLLQCGNALSIVAGEPDLSCGKGDGAGTDQGFLDSLRSIFKGQTMSSVLGYKHKGKNEEWLADFAAKWLQPGTRNIGKLHYKKLDRDKKIKSKAGKVGEYEFVIAELNDTKEVIDIFFKGTQTLAEVGVDLNYDADEMSFGSRKVHIHRGFKELLGYVWKRAETKDDDITVDKMCSSYKKIRIYGFSLGGALAQLLGMKLATDKRCSQMTIEVYAMSSPKVGLQDYCDAFKQLHPRLRVFMAASDHDVLTMMPHHSLFPPGKYKHCFTTRVRVESPIGKKPMKWSCSHSTAHRKVQAVDAIARMFRKVKGDTVMAPEHTKFFMQMLNLLKEVEQKISDQSSGSSSSSASVLSASSSSSSSSSTGSSSSPAKKQ